MIELVLGIVLFPAIGTLIVALAIPRGRTDGSAHPTASRTSTILTGLAIAAGFVAASWRQDGAPTFPPVTAQHWLPLLAVGGWLSGSVVSLAMPRPSTERTAPLRNGLPLIVVSAATSFACLYSYTARLSALAAAISVAVSICVVVHLARRNQAFAAPACLASGAPLVWLIHVTWRYNEMADATFVLLLVAAAIALLPRLPFERTGSRIRSVALRTIPAAIGGMIAVYLTYRDYEPW